MRIISEQELKNILDKHNEWLKDSSKGKRADLSFVDLSSADLRFANLSSANLSSANLSFVDLSFANLSFANLRSANLRSVNLRSANLMTFQFQQHICYFTFDGFLRIGCEYWPLRYWQDEYQSIGKKAGYTDLQIKMYGMFIKQCIEASK